MKKYKWKEEHMLKDEYIKENMLIKRNGERWEYREITEEAFLNRGYKSLFWMREKNLSWPQKLRLRQILREFDPYWYLRDAWIYKEWFCEAIDDLNIEEIRRIRDECLGSDHYRISWFGKTLLKRDKQLEAFCTHSTDKFKFTNAYTESINNQCKVAKRVSHGFKYKSSYKRKLSARFINQQITDLLK
jgi:transposase